MDIVLHQWEVSPYCGKVRSMLQFKGLPYRVVNYNGLLARKVAGLSPTGKLPVLDIDGQRIHDSRRIGDELERRFPTPAMMPACPRQRAQVHVYQDWADESLYVYNLHFRTHHKPAWRKAVAALGEGRPRPERWLMGMVTRSMMRQRLKAQGFLRMPAPEVEARFWMLMRQLDQMLSGQAWLVGETKTLADISVGAQLHEIARTTDIQRELAGMPHLAGWLQRF